MKLDSDGLAAAFDVSDRTIRRWSEAGMPSRATDGGREFELAACIAWRIEEERRRVLERETGDSASTSWKLARARKEGALATKHELEVQLRAGELVEAEEVRIEFESQFARVREALLAWPGRVAATLASRTGADVREMSVGLEEEVRGLLTRLSRGEFE